MVISQGKTLEGLPPVDTVQRGTSMLAGYSFNSKTFDVYKACRIKYFDPIKKEEQSYTFTPPDAPAVGQVLQVNQRVESLTKAQKTARGALRRRNRQEVTCVITSYSIHYTKLYDEFNIPLEDQDKVYGYFR